MKKSTLGIGLGISAIFAVALNFLPLNAKADMPVGKIPCHSSSSPGSGHTFTQCSTCSVAQGIGSDAGQCRPN